MLKKSLMKRKLILTQSQLNEICDGDCSYLDGLSKAPDKPENMHANEITVDGGIIDGYGEPVTTDRFSDTLAPKNGLWRMRGDYTRIAESKKGDWIRKNIINETNQGLDGQNITATVGNGNNSYNITGSEGTLAVRKHRAEQNGNDEEADAIGKALNNRRKPIENRKKALKNLGIDNMYQKAGGKKSSGNGKAHTKKKDGTNQYIDYF